MTFLSCLLFVVGTGQLSSPPAAPPSGADVARAIRRDSIVLMPGSGLSPQQLVRDGIPLTLGTFGGGAAAGAFDISPAAQQYVRNLRRDRLIGVPAYSVGMAGLIAASVLAGQNSEHRPVSSARIATFWGTFSGALLASLTGAIFLDSANRNFLRAVAAYNDAVASAYLPFERER